MKILKIILAVIVILLSIYMVVDRNLNLLFLNQSVLGLFFLVTGIEETQRVRLGYKWIGWMLIAISVFLFFASILGFLLT